MKLKPATKQDGRLIGYARVSRDEQSVGMQVDALKKAGCSVIYSEKESGARWNRPELHRMLGDLQTGDSVVVWKCDRLARSQADLANLVAQFEVRDIRFLSLTESFDTRTPNGRMFLQILTSFGEFERAVIRERTMAGLDHARRQGRIGGRPVALKSEHRDRLREDLLEGSRTYGELAALYRVSVSTISRFAAKVRGETALCFNAQSPAPQTEPGPKRASAERERRRPARRAVAHKE